MTMTGVDEAVSVSARPRPRTTGSPMVAKYDGDTILTPPPPSVAASPGLVLGIRSGIPSVHPCIGSADVSATWLVPGTARSRSRRRRWYVRASSVVENRPSGTATAAVTSVAGSRPLRPAAGA